MMDISGATVHRGILDTEPRGIPTSKVFSIWSRDLPLMVAVIDSAEKIQEATTVVEQMVEDA
jgi:PII-like signaling protein